MSSDTEVVAQGEEAQGEDAPFFCPVCREGVDAFVEHNGRQRARCPSCRVLERHRFLGYMIDRLSPVLATASVVLEIAPQPGIRAMLTELVGARYIGLDIAAVRLVDVCGDLEGLPFADDTFDVIVCYHVLEHIPDDRAAMRELARVLTPRGLMLMQVPIRVRRPTEDDPDAPPEERARRFGQHDHLRFYGDDLDERLLDAGLESVRLHPEDTLTAHELDRYSINTKPLWLCRKRDAWTPRRPTVLGADALRQTSTG